MTIIDRYISKLFLGYFLGALVAFSTLFVVFDFLSFAVRYAEVGAKILALYYAYFLPSVLYQMIPVGCLLATVFTLAELSRAQELTALFSMGTSLFRVCAPIFLWVIGLALVVFWLSDRILPYCEQKKNFIYYNDMKKRPGLFSTVTTGRIWYRSQNILFNIKTLNFEDHSAEGLSLYYFDDQWNLIQLITAKEVDLKGTTWNLRNGTVTLFLNESSFPLNKPFESKTIVMNEEVSDLQASAKPTDLMTIAELRRFISKNKEAGLETVRLEVDYHAKYAFAFACFVMCLMGIPFSVKNSRSGGFLKSAGVCLVLAFGYWVFYSSAMSLGRHGDLPPLMAAWSANFVAVGLAGGLILRLRK